MASISKTYSTQAAPGAASDILFVRPGQTFDWTSVGTIDAGCEVAIQIEAGAGVWRDLKRWSAGAVNASGTIANDSPAPARFRFLAEVPTTDPATVLTDYTVTATEATNTLEEWRNPEGVIVFTITEAGISAPVVTATTQVVADTIAERTAAAGVTADGVKMKDGQVYTDQINEKTSAAGVTIDGVQLKDGGITLPNGAIQFPRGTAATQILAGFGVTSAEGMQLAAIDETVSFVDNTDLFKALIYTFPAGTQILCAQMNNVAGLTGGGTTAKVGLGTESDPDLFGLSSALTKNTKTNTTPAWSPFSGSTALRLSACTSGGAAGDTALTVGSVRVRILFIVPVSLADAA